MLQQHRGVLQQRCHCKQGASKGRWKWHREPTNSCTAAVLRGSRASEQWECWATKGERESQTKGVKLQHRQHARPESADLPNRLWAKPTSPTFFHYTVCLCCHFPRTSHTYEIFKPFTHSSNNASSTTHPKHYPPQHTFPARRLFKRIPKFGCAGGVEGPSHQVVLEAQGLPFQTLPDRRRVRSPCQPREIQG